jgi:Raf kinase inhibitor-like YbhB/YbcL family protein
MNREGLVLAVALALAACGPSPAKERPVAQQQGEQHAGGLITILRVQPREQSGIEVTSPAVGVDGRIADRYSAYHDNLSPPLRWSAVPGAKAYALIVEDPDAPRATPFLHWIAWDIPGEATQLPEGLANAAHPVSPQGMIQGKNGGSSYGYFGPRPPSGVHHYHFQLFALDAPLKMDADSKLEEIVGALKAHTIAEGELVGLYEAPTSQ